MIYSTRMIDENNVPDWAQTSTILGIAFAITAFLWKWVAESFKNRREERENVIRIAVREAMSEVRGDIENVRKESAEGLKHVHQRIDQVFEKLGK